MSRSPIVPFAILAVLAVVAYIVLPFAYILLTGDFPGAVWAHGLEEDSNVIGALFDLREAVHTN